jgi:hypothetical protein
LGNAYPAVFQEISPLFRREVRDCFYSHGAYEDGDCGRKEV